ncbi:GNAT family N-acetyltransferase [Levilactobacillus fujinensis]|uniref:GNAT family N-acetyltransferase n=1 Tax=Levilactobacillus fujinensis TaxID=2486024 RepID=A0ABW1TJ99_9LACO
MAVRRLYLKSWPTTEQVPFSILRFKAQSSIVHFYSLYDANQFVGFTYLIFHEDTIYIFYLAIEPASQTQGYGGELLEQLKATYPQKRLSVTIEYLSTRADNYTQRVQRRRFFENHGFKMADFWIEEQGLPYQVMTWNGDMQSKELEKVVRHYSGILFRFFVNLEVHTLGIPDNY